LAFNTYTSGTANYIYTEHSFTEFDISYTELTNAVSNEADSSSTDYGSNDPIDT